MAQLVKSFITKKIKDEEVWSELKNLVDHTKL